MNESFKVAIGDEVFSVAIEGGTVIVNGNRYMIDAVFMGERDISLLLDGTVSYAYVVGASLHPSEYHPKTGNPFQISIDGHTLDVLVDDRRSTLQKTLNKAMPGRTGSQQIVAPMPGLVAKILVSAGEQVSAGKGVVILEAMKMENEIRASQSGAVKEIMVKPGQAVEKGQVLARLGPSP